MYEIIKFRLPIWKTKTIKHCNCFRQCTSPRDYLYTYVYKTECLFVCIYCIQIYSFTPILMKFWTLDLQNKKKITVYFNFTKTNPDYHFNPVKKKRQFFRVGNTLTFAASPLFHPPSISSPSPLDTHKKQPLLSFLSLLSTKKIFRVGNRVCMIFSGVIVTFGCL
jgi:hypothetical protein